MTTLTFLLYRPRGVLIRVSAEVPEDLIAERELEPGEVRVSDSEGVPLCAVDEDAALDALEHIRRVAAALAHRPWEGQYLLRWPEWAPPFVAATSTPRAALVLAALWWSDWQCMRHEEDQPTERSDAQTHREEAPYGSQQ